MLIAAAHGHLRRATADSISSPVNYTTGLNDSFLASKYNNTPTGFNVGNGSSATGEIQHLFGGMSIEWEIQSGGVVKVVMPQAKDPGMKPFPVEPMNQLKNESMQYCNKTIGRYLEEFVKAKEITEGGKDDLLLKMIELSNPSPPQTSCDIPRPDRKYSDSECRAASDIFSGARAEPYQLVDASIFGYDLDLMELKLNELEHVVDLFVIIESSLDHHLKPKPLVWERNMDKARFSRFKDKILHIKVSFENRNVAGIWESEREQEQLGYAEMMKALQTTLKVSTADKGKVLICWGDADEIVDPYNAALMKRCEAKALPVDNGAWFAMGDFSQAFKSDWPVPGHPYTFGSPAFRDAADIPTAANGFSYRTFGRTGRFLLGGWHLSNHPYPPFMLMKAMSCSECKGDTSKKTLQEWVTKLDPQTGSLNIGPGKNRPDYPGRFIDIRNLKQQAAYAGNERLFRIPEYVQCNPDRYEVWFQKPDKRLQMTVC